MPVGDVQDERKMIKVRRTKVQRSFHSSLSLLLLLPIWRAVKSDSRAQSPLPKVIDIGRSLQVMFRR
jgi:hypothetical protein